MSLAESVWGDNIDQADSLDFIYSQVKNLRKKLKQAEATIELKGCLWIRLQTLRTMKLLSNHLPQTCIAAVSVDGGVGVLFYYAIIDEVVDETDDTLEELR